MGKSQEKEEFSKYLDQEYIQIASAHFKTLEVISNFFKYYLVIMGLPISIGTYLLAQGRESANLNKLLSNLSQIGGLFFLILSGVGFAVMLYIINLRLDALLYARTVNGIRKYFYDRAAIDLNVKLHIRTLPQTKLLPEYYEEWYFAPVILAFAFLNSIYFYLGFTFLEFSKLAFYLHIYIISILFFLAHFLSYKKISEQRDKSYLKSNIIGIDIDGVLNRHREHFCEVLKHKTGKAISPDSIYHIPVHESELNISKDEEIQVFNDPKYWLEMPIIQDAEKNLNLLKDEFNLQICLFTKRPWPAIAGLTETQKEDLLMKWRDELQNAESAMYSTNSDLIEHITRFWLKKYNINYDNLMVEKSASSNARKNYSKNNRYIAAQKNKIKFFVEDDADQAEKLSYICDVVFLINHPYNRYHVRNLPSNIVRVDSWDEIYRSIRRFS